MLLSVVGYSQLTGEDGSGGPRGGGSSAQGNFLPEVVPPSPEAAALSRFTEVPVSHYSGLANVSIPIHTISVKGIQIPISLSYHGRGVKVSETAPRTGMGWSLTYGGDVSRQIRGKADDGAGQNTYFLNKNDFISYSSDKNVRAAVSEKEVQDPSYDFYPDQFTFSGGGSSGKFVFNYKDLANPVIQSFGDVKISYQRESGGLGKISSFQITDASGNIFYYGVSKDGLRRARDYQNSSVGISVYNNGNQVQDGPTASDKNYSSWKLLDIETVYGELISYHYEKEQSSVRFEKSVDRHESNSTFTNSTRNMSDITKISSKVSRIDATNYQLQKITYNQGSVVFTKETTGRLDYNGHALDKITIYDQNNIKVKAFDLNYTYTTSTDQTNLLSYFINNPDFTNSFKRMFLSSVEEEGNNGTRLPPYEFTYNATVLPSRFSTRQDYWGYYNGATNNGPFLRMFNYGSYQPDRRVHLEHSKAGMLEEIKYPTGGVTKFTYEHNQGLVPSQITDNVILPKVNPQSVSEVKIRLSKSDFIDPTTGQYKTLYFDVNSDTFTYQIGCIHLRYEDGDPNIPDCIFGFMVNGSPADPGSINQLPVSNGRISLSVSNPRHPSVPIDLYTNEMYDFDIIITYQPNERMLYAGGKRVKKIEYISENNTKVKEFEYSGGSIHGLPGYVSRGGEYDYQYNTESGVMTEAIDMFHYFDQTSAFSSFQGNSIGYSYITEYNGTEEDNEGMIKYNFTNFSDSGGDYYEFPYHPPTDNEWLRGKNIKTRIFGYNKDMDGYILQREIYNKYQYANNTYSQDFDNIALFDENFVVAPGTPDDWRNFVFTPKGKEYHWNNNTTSDYSKGNIIFQMPLYMKKASYSISSFDWAYRVYHLTGGTVNLNRTIERNYFNGKVLESETRYFYDYNNHYQLKSSEMTDSKGAIYKTVNDFYLPLLNQNRMQPVTTTSYKDGVKLSTQHSEYKTAHGILLPEKIQTSKGRTQTLEDRAIFHSYDTTGNPVEVSKKDGSKIYYVWGYDKTQPIAKIENYTSISSAQQTAITNAINASNNDVSVATENTLRSSLTALRNAFSASQVTTFTYNPLIGVTSITDPRGEVVYYEYDEFNRLKFVKNTEGEILKEHSYNYKN